ncbi:MAG: hypothetical protein KJO11_04990, partial [Gemmatimonadetes bacterium]|nr:hypothetical protein [Gemmatimonadota bacterium]
MNCFPARGIGLVLVAASAACASSGAGSESQEFDPSLPIACVDIDNRQGSGTLERVYLVQVERRRSGRQGEGVRIGDAPVGRVTRFCTQNIQ